MGKRNIIYAAILILVWRGRNWKLALNLRWSLPTSLLEIPCSILDIQEHSRGGAESAEAEIFHSMFWVSCLPAKMKIAGIHFWTFANCSGNQFV